jgi:hypothetical protein
MKYLWKNNKKNYLEIKSILAIFVALELVLVKVRPAPDAGIDHVRESLFRRNLEE